MSQVDGRANVLVDLEVTRDERESAHVVSGPPRGGIGLGRVDGVLASALQGLLQELGVFLYAVVVCLCRDHIAHFKTLVIKSGLKSDPDLMAKFQ